MYKDMFENFPPPKSLARRRRCRRQCRRIILKLKHDGPPMVSLSATLSPSMLFVLSATLRPSMLFVLVFGCNVF